MNIIDIIQNIIAVAGSLASLGVVALLLMMLATHGVRRTIATTRRFVDIAVGKQAVESTFSYVETSNKLSEQIHALSKRYAELQAQTVALNEERNECRRIVVLMQRRIDELHNRINRQEQHYHRLAAAVEIIGRHAEEIESITKDLQRVVECAICKGGRCDYQSNPSNAEC